MLPEVTPAYVDTYTRAMRANINDKLFFAEDLEADVLVDFGCADGSLLRELGARRPDLQLVGFDASREMIIRANSMGTRALFFSDADLMKDHLQRYCAGKRVALLASSVLHEVHAYEEGDDVWNFWELVNHPAFTAFVLRDMCVEAPLGDQVSDDVYGAVLQRADRHQLESFEARYGTVRSTTNMVHFMLKSPWKANWAREVEEDYTGVKIDRVLTKLHNRGYMIDSIWHGVLPAVKDRVALEFGTYVPSPTHLKIIAYRR